MSVMCYYTGALPGRRLFGFDRTSFSNLGCRGLS